MNSETVYVKLPQIAEVYERNVYLKDIGEVYCQNSATAARIRTVKVTAFPECGKRGMDYVGSIMELLPKIEAAEKNVQVSCVGETDFIVKYKPHPGKSRLLQRLKTVFVAVAAFCGSGFAIMTFNNDASIRDVFSNLYRIVLGTDTPGTAVLEISYSLGLAAGILVFFNHFAGWKLTVDPTPIEVEMRLYEENLNKALIRNGSRKESGVDVS